MSLRSASVDCGSPLRPCSASTAKTRSLTASQSRLFAARTVISGTASIGNRQLEIGNVLAARTVISGAGSIGNRQLEIGNVLARSSKIVAESNDVVLAKIAATLHFDKY